MAILPGRCQVVVQAAEGYRAPESALNGEILDGAEGGGANLFETSVKLETSAAGCHCVPDGAQG